MTTNTPLIVKYVDYRHVGITEADHDSAQPLKINDKNISFFDDVLFRSFRLSEQSSNVWLLTFFNDSPFETHIKVVLSEQPIPYAKDSIGNAYRIDSDEITESVINRTRELLSSKSLDKDNFKETALNSYLTTSGRGFVYVTTKPGQFERAVLLNGLALAYKLRMQSIAEKVSAESINGILSPKLLRYCGDGFLFNAACYTKYPVKLENREIRAFLEAFEDHWRLTDLNEELTRQLEAIHTSVQFHETQATSERHQNQNIKLALMITVIGLIITLLSTYIAHVFGWNT